MTRASSQTPTATVMTTALDGERQHVVAGVRHAGQHVGHIGDLNDGERVSIHCGVVHGRALRRTADRLR